MSEQPFVPVLLGADINVYSMARAFHEAYGIKTIAFGRYPSGPCYRSDIIDYRVCENNSDPAVVLKNVSAVVAEHPDKKVFVLAAGTTTSPPSPPTWPGIRPTSSRPISSSP